MPIQRTTMIDDDGSGTTGTILNNAWLQTIYGQIDTVIGVPGTWTPTDASGAGLVFTGVQAHYVLTGPTCFWTVLLNYPANASGAGAVVAGFPFPVARLHGGGVTTYGPAMMIHQPFGGVQGHLFKSGAVAWTNQELSGATLIAQGSYFTL